MLRWLQGGGSTRRDRVHAGRGWGWRVQERLIGRRAHVRSPLKGVIGCCLMPAGIDHEPAFFTCWERLIVHCHRT